MIPIEYDSTEAPQWLGKKLRAIMNEKIRSCAFNCSILGNKLFFSFLIETRSTSLNMLLTVFRRLLFATSCLPTPTCCLRMGHFSNGAPPRSPCLEFRSKSARIHFWYLLCLQSVLAECEDWHYSCRSRCKSFKMHGKLVLIWGIRNETPS